jgi:N6-L-threonylcarbamoyladenine synthase
VAANSRLREAFKQAEKEVKVLFPPPSLCTDNAAMIAGAAYFRLKEGLTADLSTDASARDGAGRNPMPTKGS